MKDETDLLVLNVKRPDEALFKKSEDMLEYVRGWEITTPEKAIHAGNDLKAIKTLAKEIEAKRTAITGPLNKALKEVNTLFRPAKSWLKEAEGILKSKLLEYQNEQERVAREAQAKADAEAEKERKKLERAAKLAETMRRPAKAEELREEAEKQTAPVVKSAAPKLKGIARRETWKAEVVDKLELLKHIVNSSNDMGSSFYTLDDLLKLVQIDQSALNALARQHKDGLDLPGVRVVKEASIAARGNS